MFKLLSLGRTIRERPGFLILLLAGLGLWFFLPQPAGAHPLGNFSINRYSRLDLSTQKITLFYVLDMAEIPTFQEWPNIDTDRDDRASPAEQTRYVAEQIAELQEKLRLEVNGRLVPLRPTSHQLSFPPGQGDLRTLRLEVTFVADLSTSDAWNIHYIDNNYSDRVGWQEVVVRPGSDVTLLHGDPVTEDVSRALRQYPEDMLQSPLAINQASLEFGPANVLSGSTTGNRESALIMPVLPESGRFSSDRFADLIAVRNLEPGLLLVVLATAFGLGAMHALSPGHGKTIVGAYLVGSRGTAKHALFLGLVTTVTHTGGVFLFGLLVLFASRYILPEQLYPWLGVLSGLLVVTIGLSMFWSRWQQHIARHHHDHHHDHDHGHDHDHHDHHHDHGYHYHLGVGHSHVPPQSSNGNVSWRNLLALGISGGLAPCPSALVVLLSAIALQRVAFGLVLIVIFSLGLASVLTGIGLLLVYAGKLFQRLPSDAGRFVNLLPIASALFITLAGIGIAFQAFLQTGLL